MIIFSFLILDFIISLLLCVFSPINTLYQEWYFFLICISCYVVVMIILVLLFALFLKSFYAIGANYDFEVDGIYYQLVSREDKSVCVCNPGYNAYDYKDVVIPSSVTYAGYDFTVVGIRLWAFESCYDIKSLTLPETIEWIDQQAFDRCRIKKVNILNLNKWAQISSG